MKTTKFTALEAAQGKTLLQIIKSERGDYEKDGEIYTTCKTPNILCPDEDVHFWVEVESVEKYLEEKGYKKVAK
jgi:hypothetical protein